MGYGKSLTGPVVFFPAMQGDAVARMCPGCGSDASNHQPPRCPNSAFDGILPRAAAKALLGPAGVDGAGAISSSPANAPDVSLRPHHLIRNCGRSKAS